MRYPSIIATGMAQAPRLVTNDFFDQYYGRPLTPFLVQKRGIQQRRFMDDSQTTSDLVVQAAQDALSQAGMNANSLDLLIVATDTPDQFSPSTAAVAQHKLGATRAGTFDLNSACAGFVTAFDLAQKALTADEHLNTALVVGAYAMSRFFDWNDYKVTSVFADGAGATLLSKNSAHAKTRASLLRTQGQYHSYMGVYGGGVSEPFQTGNNANGRPVLEFRDRIPPETNPKEWPAVIHTLLDRAHWKLEEVERFFLTQINIESIWATMDQLKLPYDKAHLIMDRYGYTGSACIPMALADANQQGMLQRGDKIILLGSGGGMAMAGTAIEW